MYKAQCNILNTTKTLPFSFPSLYIVPAVVRVAQQVTGTTQRNQVAYFQYQLPVEGMTIRLKMDSGRAELYATHMLRNPSSAFYDYHFSTHSNADVYIDPSELEGSNNDTMRRRVKREQEEREVVSTNLTNVTLFVSIKGLDENNSFILATTFGDTSTCEYTDSLVYCTKNTSKINFLVHP